MNQRIVCVVVCQNNACNVIAGNSTELAELAIANSVLACVLRNVRNDPFANWPLLTERPMFDRSAPIGARRTPFAVPLNRWVGHLFLSFGARHLV